MLWFIDTAASCSIEQFVLRPYEVLYEFDGPRIFTTISESLIYLWYECGEDPETERIRYLVIPANQQLIGQLKSGEKTMLEALRQPWLWALDVRNGQVEKGWTLNDLDLVPLGAKPRPNVFLWPQLEPLASAPCVKVDKRVSFGSDGGFRGILEWRDDYGSQGSVGATWGDLQLWVGDTLVWGQLDETGKVQGVTSSWIELLGFLGNAWPYLTEEEQLPIVLNKREERPKHLGELCGRAKIRWRQLNEQEIDAEDALLRDFLAVHDLAGALLGAQPPQLLLLRQGNQMLVATPRQEWVLPFAVTMSTLEKFCVAIKDKIAHLQDIQSETARSRWDNRESMPAAERLQIATGIEKSLLDRIWPTSLEAANDKLYELKAAARMIGSKLPGDQLKIILSKIYDLPNGKHLDLGNLHQKATSIIDEHRSSDPATQGYLLAYMLREHLNCITGKVEPKDILVKWGVSVKKIEISNSSLDAIAVWGAAHTPTILLNTDGPRAKLPAGTRSTLAHEICHLLVDINGALPAAEVFGGNIPYVIEQRANAFAAEFLLPRAVAGNRLAEGLEFSYIPDERYRVTEETVSHLANFYGTSHETTAWQIINSGISELTEEVIKALNTHLKSISDPFENSAPE
ncbi:MAG: ImmA/IrrE family metallo-endopeptidase [Gallionella sp.]|nr:ImmA/IrrE family metallo-endopeptidase [Gallionella sp.]